MLSPIQHSLVVGTLLGDGSMRCKKNALLEINHCVTQRAYVDWKFRLLSDLVRMPPKPRNCNGGRQAYRFTTLSLPALTPYYRLFYTGDRKVIPEIALTPLALAVWYMDDGSRSYRAAYLNTQQFSIEDQERLLLMLQAQWDLTGALNRDKHYYRIRLSVDSARRFKGLVEPYILPEMRYKLPR